MPKYRIIWRNAAGDTIDRTVYDSWDALCASLTEDQSGWHQYMLSCGHEFTIEQA